MAFFRAFTIRFPGHPGCFSFGGAFATCLWVLGPLQTCPTLGAFLNLPARPEVMTEGPGILDNMNAWYALL